MRRALPLAASFMLAATLTLVSMAGPAAADTGVTGFEDFALGPPDGQFGWSATGSAGSGCALYDHAIVSNTYGIASFGTKSLRMSNAVTSGCFGDQTFSASVTNEAGEASAEGDGLSGGTRQTYFEAEWDFASTVPASEQQGLSVVASPDRGDGARMSWIQMVDTPAGLDVNFSDYQTAAGDFVASNVVSGLNRSTPHHIKITVEFVDGVANDVVEVYVDGVLEHTGTSWEDYFRDVEGNPTRTVDSILFRTGGPAAPANAGNGFLIDNLRTTTSPVPTSTTVVVDPPNMNGWVFFNEGATGDGGLVFGPAGALNDGSAQLVVDATGRHNIGTLAFGGTRLDEISELSYSSYRASADPGNLFAVSLQFEFDDDLTDLNDTFRGRLVFEPYLTVGSGNIAEDTWYTWNTLDGKWWSSNAGFAATCSQASPCTIQKVLATWPNAGIRKSGVTPSSGLLNFRVGGPWGPGFDGNVDDFRIAISGTQTIFDFEPETPCSAVCYVNDATGNDAFGGSTPGTAKKTIQAAVNQVDVSGNVIVAPGTYSELVTVSKSLTISGAQAGIDARGRSGDESIVQGNAGTTSFLVTADDVTIDGFTVRSQTNVNQFGAGIVLGAGTSQATIVNNIVTQNVVGLFLANDNGSGQTLLRHNVFSGNNNPGSASGHGIYTDQFIAGGTVENVLIDENLFEDNAGQGVGFSSTSATAPATDITMSGNTFDGNGRGLYAFNLTDSTITNNTFVGSTDGATADIRIFEGVSDLTIDHNLLMDGAGSAYRASDLGTGSPAPTGMHLNRNSITGYGPVTTVRNDVAIPTLDAECNWWGGITGPGAPNSTVGTNVDAAPWLLTSDLDGACIGGTWTFQGFFSPVDNDDPNAVKAGRSVPLKWRILDGAGIPIDDPSSFLSLTSVACDDPLDVVDESNATNTGLVSLGDGYWQFNWDTDPDYKAECRILVLTLGDGSVHTAEFEFK